MTLVLTRALIRLCIISQAQAEEDSILVSQLQVRFSSQASSSFQASNWLPCNFLLTAILTDLSYEVANVLFKPFTNEEFPKTLESLRLKQLLSSGLTTAVPMSPSGIITATPLWVNNGDGDLFVASGPANHFNDASLLGGKFLISLSSVWPIIMPSEITFSRYWEQVSCVVLTASYNTASLV